MTGPLPLVVLGSLALAAAVAAPAWRLGALTGKGAVAATAVGALTVGFAGLGPALVLVLFFVSSSALSWLGGGAGRSRRNARQVLANGSVAALLAVVYHFDRGAAIAFLGAIAAATADTWATEIGTRFGGVPRSLLSWRERPRGASGAVSGVGTGAAAVGALAVAGAGAWLVADLDGRLLAVVAIAGFTGSLFDSLLGDSVQAKYRCESCAADLEVAVHEGCAGRARRVSGLPGLDNDAVNWLATLAGAAVVLLLLIVWR